MTLIEFVKEQIDLECSQEDYYSGYAEDRIDQMSQYELLEYISWYLKREENY